MGGAEKVLVEQYGLVDGGRRDDEDGKLGFSGGIQLFAFRIDSDWLVVGT